MPALEVIVIDDCSTDLSRTIAEDLARDDFRLRLVKARQNGGVAAARNIGLAEARGEWICILDADDLLAPDRLEHMLAKAKQNAADILSDNLMVFYDDWSSKPHCFLEGFHEDTSIDIARYLDETVMYSNGANFGFLKPLIRRRFLQENNIIYDETLRIGEDDDLILRMLLGGAKYLVCKDALYGYRKHSASISYRLPSDAAKSLERSARKLESAWLDSEFSSRLSRRRRAISRARAFAEFVDSLKRRNLVKFLALVAANVTAIPLLRMPIGAALGRMTTSSPGARHGGIQSRRNAIDNWDDLQKEAL